MPPTRPRTTRPAPGRPPRCGRRARPRAGSPGPRRCPGVRAAATPAPAAVPGPTSACTSTSSGRRPWKTGTTSCRAHPPCDRPTSAARGRARRAGRRPASRRCRPRRPGPKRCLIAVSTRERGDDHRRTTTRCRPGARRHEVRPGRRPWARAPPGPAGRRATWPSGSASRCTVDLDRLPAGWARSGSDTDCSESTTDKGRTMLGTTAASIASTSGPSRAKRCGGTGPSPRRAPPTWVSDSSAEASMTSTPVAATDERTWKTGSTCRCPGGPNRG